MTMCEYVMEVAEGEAQSRLNESMVQLISTIADEIIETVEEYEPEFSE